MAVCWLRGPKSELVKDRCIVQWAVTFHRHTETEKHNQQTTRQAKQTTTKTKNKARSGKVTGRPVSNASNWVRGDSACHPCAGAMLIFSVSFQFYRMIPEGNPQKAILLQVQRNGNRGTVADWRCLTPPVLPILQRTILFGILWVLLSQAFATWRGSADSVATLLAGYFFLCLRWQWIVLSRLGVALLSFVLVSWCVVCFWAPPLRRPWTPNAATLRVGLCMSPGVQYHPVKK